MRLRRWCCCRCRCRIVVRVGVLVLPAAVAAWCWRGGGGGAEQGLTVAYESRGGCLLESQGRAVLARLGGSGRGEEVERGDAALLLLLLLLLALSASVANATGLVSSRE